MDIDQSIRSLFDSLKHLIPTEAPTPELKQVLGGYGFETSDNLRNDVEGLVYGGFQMDSLKSMLSKENITSPVGIILMVLLAILGIGGTTRYVHSQSAAEQVNKIQDLLVKRAFTQDKKEAAPLMEQVKKIVDRLPNASPFYQIFDSKAKIDNAAKQMNDFDTLSSADSKRGKQFYLKYNPAFLRNALKISPPSASVLKYSRDMIQKGDLYQILARFFSRLENGEDLSTNFEDTYNAIGGIKKEQIPSGYSLMPLVSTESAYFKFLGDLKVAMETDKGVSKVDTVIEEYKKIRDKVVYDFNIGVGDETEKVDKVVRDALEARVIANESKSKGQGNNDDESLGGLEFDLDKMDFGLDNYSEGGHWNMSEFQLNDMINCLLILVLIILIYLCLTPVSTSKSGYQAVYSESAY